MQDLTGRKFGRLTALKFDHRNKKHTYWVCGCECGKQSSVTQNSLCGGKTRSCGCLVGDTQRASHTTYGYTVGHKLSPEYMAWCAMKSRCYNKNDGRYEYYGARGIAVCEEWRKNYVQFLSDMGPRPTKFSIERKNNDGSYAAWNCVWASAKDQVRNRSNTVFVTFNGQQMTLQEACDLVNLPYHTAYKRMWKGRPEEEWFKPSKYA